MKWTHTVVQKVGNQIPIQLSPTIGSDLALLVVGLISSLVLEANSWFSSNSIVDLIALLEALFKGTIGILVQSLL